MTLTMKKYKSVILVDLPASITLANADDVQEALHKIVAHGYSRLLLNMAGVEFMDSSGLSVLVSLYKRLRTQGKVALLSPSVNVRALLELTRLNEILDMYEDMRNALSDLQTAA